MHTCVPVMPVMFLVHGQGCDILGGGGLLLAF